MGNNSSAYFELILWNLVKKLPFNIFKSFLKSCDSCKRNYVEIYIDRYLEKENNCKKCKFRGLIFSKIVSMALNKICRALNMPNGEFRNILSKNLSLKRLLTSYMNGIGFFGFTVPQVPAGPIVTIWSITDRCNLNCSHCYTPKNTGNHEISYKNACKVIDELYKAKNMFLGFSGGEPLLREDIFDLIQYANKKVMSTAIATNGVLIDKKVAYRLKKCGTNYVQISIDGLKDFHDNNRGEGMFQKAIEGIKNCLNAGLYVSMNTVITKLNVHQIFELFDLAKKLKVQKFELVDFVPTENASDKAYIALSPIELEQFGKIVCNLMEDLITEDYPLTISYKNPVFTRIFLQRYKNAGVMPFFKGVFPRDGVSFIDSSNRLSKGIHGEQKPFLPTTTGCECGNYILHIKPNGDITPCPLNPCVLGSIKRDNIQDIWLNSPVFNQYRKLQFEGPCGKCIYKIICGGCRAKVFLSSFSSTKSDPSCLLNVLKMK